MKTLFILSLMMSVGYSQTTTIRSTYDDGKSTAITTVRRDGNVVDINTRVVSNTYRAEAWRPHTPMVRPMLNWTVVFDKMTEEERKNALKIYDDLLEEFKKDEYSSMYDEEGNLNKDRGHHKMNTHVKHWTRKLVNGKFMAVPSTDYHWIWYRSNGL